LQRAANANMPDHFAYVFDKAREGFFIDRMEQNQNIFAKFMNDAEFKSTVAACLRLQVSQPIKGGVQA
jgi:type I restriction enzyme, R subunit